MNHFVKEQFEEMRACNIRFERDVLIIELSDGRELALPFKRMKWLDWLAKATLTQRTKWAIEPYGYAVWWEELDDGIEVGHALSLQALPLKDEIQVTHQALIASER
jgi:hypothetical protein